ncbi:sensor histidine kinase [Pedobacter agri]|uniref:sensor histidine kinase n=1 Tax=Pedobacter agri TaxID=454586 RepID=UPI002930C50E|nr:histidine kinase [Pedobacter agri]
MVVPKLLLLKKYGWLVIFTIAYFLFLTTWNNVAVAWIFEKFTIGLSVHRFFVIKSAGFYMDWNLILTDFIAFLAVAFSRFSFQNEQLKHKIETDLLHLQLNMLKTQLQPHFLFNTLNSLYGMSLTGSKETSRFILLLSQMMQYILYDCDREEIALDEEMNFLKGYFEIEQNKFPKATIVLKLPEHMPLIKIPPLLFLPLVENSFKHGKHRLEDMAKVSAELMIDDEKIVFCITNDILKLDQSKIKDKRGGIGLTNIRQRLKLYYPERNQLLISSAELTYKTELIIYRT